MPGAISSQERRVWPLAVVRLAALLACLALATGRLGLIAHELVGHGGAAVALGGRVVEVRLFWFAGGWIRYDLDPATTTAILVVTLGGMAVEIVAGVALWLALARRRSLAARLVRGAGAALVVHALWYFATGAWHGYGDGALLYKVLGDARMPVAIVAGIATCGVAFVAARGVVGAIVATLPSRRVAGAAIAMTAAAALIAGLALGELAIRRDATYGATMAHERDRQIERDLAAWLEAQRRAGVAVSDASRDEQVQRLEQQHRAFPFAWLLLACVLASLGAGALRSPRREPEPVSQRLLVTAIVVAAASIALVIAADAAFAV